ncbi:MAG: EF-hand domain-containing protein [Sphingomonas sp.]
MIESCPVHPYQSLASMIALLLALLAPTAAAPLRAQAAQAPTARITPPITQPPGATIRAEPVALFIGACDANGDAQVTRTELAACTARSFADIARGATSLGYIQFSDWSLKWLGDRNALPSPFETDADGDNRLVLGELQAQLDKTFTRLDRNKDGVLTRDELLTLGAFGGSQGRDSDNGGGRRRQSGERQ